MNRIKNRIRKNFTIVPNELINDKSLSSSTRFVFVWMASKPDEWEFNRENMCTELGLSKNTLTKHLADLETAGWLTRIQQRVHGQFTSNSYWLNERAIVSQKLVHGTVSQKTPCGKNWDTALKASKKDFSSEEKNSDSAREKNSDLIRGLLSKYYRDTGQIPLPVGRHTKYMNQLMTDHGFSIADLENVMNQKIRQAATGDMDQKYLTPAVIFKPENFIREMNIMKSSKPAESEIDYSSIKTLKK